MVANWEFYVLVYEFGPGQGGWIEERRVDGEQTGGRNGRRTEGIDKRKDGPTEGRTI